MDYIYLGYNTWAELFDEELNRNIDIEFYYEDVKYMISTEWIGTKKHKEKKRCFSLQNGISEDYEKSFRAYDTWDELFEKATFPNGKKLFDEICAGKVIRG